jgi:preprotein translocase subunit YajC
MKEIKQYPLPILQFKVGDRVTTNDGIKGIVTAINEAERAFPYTVLWDNVAYETHVYSSVLRKI